MKLYNFEFEKIGEGQWEMEKDYQGQPLRIFAEEKLLTKLEKEVFIQGRNVAQMPGLAGPVYLMPDAHSGYGAPIGTVFAMDGKEGYVSPGAIGYDINCLSADTEILTSFGYRKKIKDFLNGRNSELLTSIDFSTEKPITSNIVLILKKKANPFLIKITTLLGKTIFATSDHPFLTQRGMKEAGNLTLADKVALYFFEGVKYEKPTNEIIIDENSLLRFPLPFKSDYQKVYLINELKKRKFLPLRYSSSYLPYLIKIFGYNLGDGSLTFTEKTQSVGFWGKEEDLKEIIADLQKLGYRGKIYKRKRVHKIKKYQFSSIENSIHLSAGSLVLLLSTLGCPVGNKTKKEFQIPSWLKKAPLWQKRLFLAAFFGAEMNAPKVARNHQTTFYMPTISLNKHKKCLKSGIRFLNDLKKMLRDFGIKSTPITTEETEGEKVRLRLQIYADLKNLINFYAKIGFEYHNEKKFLASVTLGYLKLKNYFILKRKEIERKADQLYKERGDLKKILVSTDLKITNKRFLERSIFEKRKTSPRIPKDFIPFYRFLKEKTIGLGQTGAIWDQLVSIEKIPYRGEVYDFTVDHQDHNFIANNFVVSNCGMRLISTNLSISEVKPRIEKLVNLLFDYIPPGVGRRGFLKVNRQELKRLTEEGVSYLVKSKGIGWEEDISHIEENGKIEGADFGCVSSEAIERGINQLATLGSGNHYLEIQKVEEIFDFSTAAKFGINSVNQVVVMVHCGSRGFGHQVCSDYLRIFEKHLSDFKLQLADRQLACAPISSSYAKKYLCAMACAANFAFVNREAITYQIRKVFERVFGKKAQDLQMKLIYDVAHNIGKFERHFIPKNNGDRSKIFELLVHRKGATRSFPDQPVIIGGSMETGSYLLIGTDKSLEKSYGSTAHGSGRTMSRSAAKKIIRGETLWQKMKEQGIYVKSASYSGLAEEAGLAYKNISDVVKSIEFAGLSKPVAYFKPMGNIKG